jgi:hypothetical protein
MYAIAPPLAHILICVFPALFEQDWVCWNFSLGDVSVLSRKERLRLCTVYAQ